MNKYNSYKIQILALTSIFLMVIVLWPSKTIDISLYLEGDKATSATVLELFLDYDKSLVMTAYSKENLLKVLSTNGFLLMPNPSSSNTPLIVFRFRQKFPFLSKNIVVSPRSRVYLKNTGITNLPNDKISFKINYE